VDIRHDHAGTFENVGDTLTVGVTFTPPIPILTGNARVNERRPTATTGRLTRSSPRPTGTTRTRSLGAITSNTIPRGSTRSAARPRGMTVTHVYVDGTNIDPTDTSDAPHYGRHRSFFYGTLPIMRKAPLIVDNVKPTVTITSARPAWTRGRRLRTGHVTDPGATYDQDYNVHLARDHDQRPAPTSPICRGTVTSTTPPAAGRDCRPPRTTTTRWS